MVLVSPMDIVPQIKLQITNGITNICIRRMKPFPTIYKMPSIKMVSFNIPDGKKKLMRSPKIAPAMSAINIFVERLMCFTFFIRSCLL